MALRSSLYKRTFQFSFQARTSRGAMKDKVSWFIRIWDSVDPEIVGVGECGPLPGLSPELTPEFELTLQQVVDKINQGKVGRPANTELTSIQSSVRELIGKDFMGYSSLVFGVETALLDLLNNGEKVIFKNSFLEGKSIPINGLIWMGGLDFMLQQIEIKIRDGFTCLKLKVGGHDFEKECDVLQYIRRKYFRDKVTIRLDANGAFKKDEALMKINQLTRFDIHSIEQPIKPGQPELMDLCKQSPIPIALDEELIGVMDRENKADLLKRVNPQFIILKPTLHGGMLGCAEWISECEQKNIGWWITSALESSIGLNAIAQFTANYATVIPQGLGTGTIYSENIESPLLVKQGHLLYEKGLNWGKIEV